MQHPTDVDTALLECHMAFKKIEAALAKNSASRRLIGDYYFRKDRTNTAARAKLRGCYKTYTDHIKYPQGEIKGLYVFAWENEDGHVEPFYVGRSRTIIRRLRQHLFGKSDNTATLAFLMTRPKERTTLKTPRKNCPHFARGREEIQQKLLTARFAIAEIEDDYTLYLAEAYVAKALKAEYNFWRTH